ncbi:MAG TPA: DUF1570 domain-containing protein [Myxococcales bacterium]
MTRLLAIHGGIAVLCAALSGCVSVRCPAEGGRPWREVTTAHLQIITDLDSEDAREAAVRFERVRHVVLGAVPLDPPGRLPVLVTNADFGFQKRWKRRAAFVTGGGALLLVPFEGFGRNARIDRGEGFAHEFSHYVVQSLFEQAPKWLDEGMAQYFGALRFDEDGRSAVLGHEDAVALKTLRSEQGLQSFGTLWKWGREDVSGMPEYRRYASSWFWVSYLVRKEGPRLQEFLRKVSAGQSAPVAWEEVFPERETREIERQVVHDYRRWFIEWPLQTVEIPPEVGSELVERELGPADYHALVARLESTGLGGRSVAEREARRASELAEARRHDPAALAPCLDRLAGASADVRLKWAQWLAAAHPESGVAHLALAASLHASQGDSEATQAALAAAAKRMKADPLFNAALADEFHSHRASALQIAALAGADAPNPEFLSSCATKRMLVSSVLRQGADGLRRCVVAGRREVAVELKMVVSAAGAIESVEAGVGEPDSEERRCAEREARSWIFPPLLVGGLVLQQRYVFRGEED